MKNVIDLTGQRFERLTVICKAGRAKDRNSLWNCRCDCGNEIIVKGIDLKRGNTRSCGCLKRDMTIKRQTTHGGCRDRLYNIWGLMRKRCKDPNSSAYRDYGARGITVCPEWNDCYESFRDWALFQGYMKDLTIDRIDNNLGYCPDNCRWVTRKVQNNNRRCNVIVEYNGEKHNMKEWADKQNINYSTLYTRINRYGWPVEKALNTPVRNEKSLMEGEQA